MYCNVGVKISDHSESLVVKKLLFFICLQTFKDYTKMKSLHFCLPTGGSSTFQIRVKVNADLMSTAVASTIE